MFTKDTDVINAAILLRIWNSLLSSVAQIVCWAM